MLRRNLRTIIEIFGKSFKDQKNAKLKKLVKLKKNYDKIEKKCFKKVKIQHNFEKFLLKCTRVHKIEIKKCLIVTEDRKKFQTKTLKKSVRRLKTILEKNEKSTERSEKNSHETRKKIILTKGFSGTFKEFSLRKTLKVGGKSTKWN